MTVRFEIGERTFTVLNGGPAFTFSEAVSVVVGYASHDDVDRYWAPLTQGGSEGQCGWLKDKYGVDIVDIAALQKAYDGK